MRLLILRLVVYGSLVLNAFQLHQSPSNGAKGAMALSVFATIVVEVNAVQQRIRQAEKLHLAGDYEGAIAQFSKALQRQPGHLEALVGRAYSHRALGHFEAALQDCNQAIQVRPDYETAYACRAKVKLDGAGDRVGAIPLEVCEAIADLEKCLELCNARTPAEFRDGAVAELERLRNLDGPTTNW